MTPRDLGDREHPLGDDLMETSQSNPARDPASRRGAETSRGSEHLASSPSPSLATGKEIASDSDLDSSIDLGTDHSTVVEAIQRTFGADALALLRDDSDFPSRSTPVDVNAQAKMASLISRIEEKASPWVRQRASFADLGPGWSRTGGVKYVSFLLGRSDCLVPMSNVLEIQRPPRVTPIPNVPPWVLGVANLRGDILSVVDLRGFLGLESMEYELAGRIMVVRSTDQELTTGLIVDRVNGLFSLSQSQIQTPNSLAQDRLAQYVRGIHHNQDRHQLVLDLDELLLSSEMRQFQPT